MREGRYNWLKKAWWHRKRCEKDCERQVSYKYSGDGDEYVWVAQALKDIVKRKAYGDICGLLDKVSLPAGEKLEVEECQRLDQGDASRLFVCTRDNKRDYEVLEHLRFEDSPMGGWQAYLLAQLWYSLPMWWHANCHRRYYVYSKEELATFYHRRGSDFDGDMVSESDVIPEVCEKEGKYCISCSFWSDFGGLRREYVEIELNNDRLERWHVLEEILYEYHCGIVF